MSAAPSAPLVVTLYSEDRRAADRDFEPQREILLGMLGLVAPFRDDAIETRPAQPIRAQRVCGSYWKKGKCANGPDKNKRRELIAHISDQLWKRRLVFFHIDADEIWERRRDAAFRQELEWFRRDIRQRARLGEKSIDDWFIPAIPYYSFEAWAYANTTLLLERLGGASDLERIDAWLEELGTLDEITKIKDHLTITDSLSHELVRRERGFPCERLAAAGKSYADTVACLRRSPPIRAHFGLPAADA